MRKPLVIGNWKMNNTVTESLQLIEQIKPLVAKAKCEVVICPPYISLESACKACEGSNVKVGAQNVHFEAKGAYTGEVSVEMLAEIGVKYVIVGHSERRRYFGETDEKVNARTVATLAGGLQAIVCVGETLEERDAGKIEEVIEKQLSVGLKGVTDFTDVIIAYEPVWAIGTGRAASLEQANEAIVMIRKAVRKYFDDYSADTVRILYGGSVTPQNASLLFNMEDVDGGLIGGASLDAEAFSGIVNAVCKLNK